MIMARGTKREGLQSSCLSPGYLRCGHPVFLESRVPPLDGVHQAHHLSAIQGSFSLSIGRLLGSREYHWQPLPVRKGHGIPPLGDERMVQGGRVGQ